MQIFKMYIKVSIHRNFAITSSLIDVEKCQRKHFFFWWPKILFFYLRFAFYTKRSHVEKTTDKRMRRTWKGKVGMIDFAIPRPVRTYRGRGWVDEESGNFHPLRLNIPIMNFEIDQLFKALPSINASVSFSIWF